MRDPFEVAPPFELTDLECTRQRFPAGNAAVELLVFWKHDCATCELTLPFVERLRAALGGAGLRVRGVCQSGPADARAFGARHGLGFPILDDSECVVSADYGVEVVPTFVLGDADGNVLAAFDGWVRRDFEDLVAVAAARLGVAGPVLFTDADRVPDFRPGCGSRTFDADVAQALAARTARATLQARRIEVGDLDDVLELFFDKGLTDGLPIVPPTEGRVLRMLDGARRDPHEVVALVPPNLVPVTVEKVAINAVMAGCKPEYFPVVLASVEAACDGRASTCTASSRRRTFPRR